MKKAWLVLAAIAFSSGIAIISCNSPAQEVENAEINVVEANNDLDKANAAYLADMETYRLETAKRIKANDESIIELNAKIAHDKKAIKAEHQKKVADLEQKNRKMKQRMDDYKAEGKEKWEIFKAEFNHDMEELGKAFKDITVKNVK